MNVECHGDDACTVQGAQRIHVKGTITSFRGQMIIGEQVRLPRRDIYVIGRIDEEDAQMIICGSFTVVFEEADKRFEYTVENDCIGIIAANKTVKVSLDGMEQAQGERT